MGRIRCVFFSQLIPSVYNHENLKNPYYEPLNICYCFAEKYQAAIYIYLDLYVQYQQEQNKDKS